MKDPMNFIERFCYKHPHFGFPRLMMYISTGTMNRIRKELIKVGKEALKRYPVDKNKSEQFAQKVHELQATMKLSDFEVDVLLVFAFVRNDLLCISDGHCRHSDLQNHEQDHYREIGYNDSIFKEWQMSKWLKGELIVLLDNNLSAHLKNYFIRYSWEKGFEYELIK